MLIGTIADEMENYREYDATVLIDPSAQALKAELESRNWVVENANNSVNDSISRIMNRLSEDKGMYGLTIAPECEKLIEEIEGYTYKEGKESPVKEGDDILDCLRYCVNHVEDEEAKYISPIFGDDDE